MHQHPVPTGEEEAGRPGERFREEWVQPPAELNGTGGPCSCKQMVKHHRQATLGSDNLDHLTSSAGFAVEDVPARNFSAAIVDHFFLKIAEPSIAAQHPKEPIGGFRRIDRSQ